MVGIVFLFPHFLDTLYLSEGLKKTYSSSQVLAHYNVRLQNEDIWE
jgi:hypothetical protein